MSQSYRSWWWAKNKATLRFGGTVLAFVAGGMAIFIIISVFYAFSVPIGRLVSAITLIVGVLLILGGSRDQWKRETGRARIR